eukprot:gene11768-biopygen5020
MGVSVQKVGSLPPTTTERCTSLGTIFVESRGSQVATQMEMVFKDGGMVHKTQCMFVCWYATCGCSARKVCTPRATSSASEGGAEVWPPSLSTPADPHHTRQGSYHRFNTSSDTREGCPVGALNVP